MLANTILDDVPHLVVVAVDIPILISSWSHQQVADISRLWIWLHESSRPSFVGYIDTCYLAIKEGPCYPSSVVVLLSPMSGAEAERYLAEAHK